MKATLHSLLKLDIWNLMMKPKNLQNRIIRIWIEQYLQADYDMFALIHSKRYHSQAGFSQKGKWKYSTQEAEEILNLLDTKSYRSIEEIANAYGKSRQLVFVYLEAFASLGMIGINRKGTST